MPHRSPRRTLRLSSLGLAASLALAVLSPARASDSKAAGFYEDALSRYEQRDLPGAIIQLKNALQIDKSMLPVQLLLGRALLANGEVLAAEVALQEALRLGVNRAEVVLPLGQAYLALGRQHMILEQQLFAPAGLPPSVQVPLLLLHASAASDLGDARGALRLIGEAATLAPRDADVWLAEVPIRIRARQFDEADAAIARAEAAAPEAAELHYQRGALAHVRGDLGAALAAYGQALQRDPRHAEALIARAGIHADIGRNAEAARDLDEVLRMLPREPRANYLRAVLAQREGKTAVQREALKQVTDLLDPVPLEAVRYRPQMLLLNALAHYELGQREKARGYLEGLQRVQPQTPAAKLLAQIHLQDGEASRAVSVLEAYLKVAPGDGQALTLLASSHMALGRSARAISLMQEALRAQDRPEHQAMLGIGLLSSGQREPAREALEAAWRKDPGQVQAGVALAGMYLRAGQPRQAVEIADVLARNAPEHAGYQDLRGMALARAGQLPAARAAFERAAALDPNWPTPQLHLARLDIAERRHDAAESRLTELLRKDDKSVDSLLELAVLAHARGRADEQQRWLVRAADHAGRGELRPHLALVDLHLQHGRGPEALEAARTLGAKAGGENMQAALALARALLANGEVVAARTTLSGASRAAGYAPQLNLQIATLQMAAEQFDGAAYSLDKVLASDPTHLGALAMQVDLDIRQGQIARAEQRARQIAQAHPRRGIGHTLVGDVASARGQSEAALAAYRRAHQVEPSSESVLRLFRQLWNPAQGQTAARVLEDWLRQHPDDLPVRRTLADGYAASGQYAAARAAYEVVLQRAPEDAGATNNLANVLLALEDARAIAVAERAVALAPADAQALDTLGWALFKSQDAAVRPRALQLLRDARLREPASAEIRYHLAVALADAGRVGEAREELGAALKSGLPSSLHAAAISLQRQLR